MSARGLINVALLGAALALALVAIYEPGLEDAPVTPRISPVDPDSVSRIRIEQPGQEPVRLMRKAHGWRLEAPLTLPADAERVRRITLLAAAESRARLPVAETDPAALGLAPPGVVLFLDDTRFAFGTTEPINARRYVQTSQAVHLITDTVYHYLRAGPNALVDPMPLGSGAQPVALRLLDAHVAYTDGQWTVTSGEGSAAAQDVTGLVQRWRTAQASIVRPLGPLPDDTDSVVISLEGESAPLRFDVLRRDQEIILARPALGIQYHFPRSAGSRLVQLSPARD